jgi:hypothetical protein
MPPLKPKPLNTAVDRDNQLLATPINDDDTGSLLSRSEQDTDSEDDEILARARNSRELRARDRLVLMDEEEMDKLVTDSRAKQQRRNSGLALPNPLRMFKNSSTRSRSASPMSVGDGVVEDANRAKRRERRERRRRKKDRLLKEAQHGEDGELMYEMESGSMLDGSSTGFSSEREDSEELDRRNLQLHADTKTEKRKRWRKWLLTHAILIVGFTFLSLLAYKMTRDKRREMPPLVSNGTALFAPTTLIISLDGFRADFLNRGLTPRLNVFVQEGVSPLYMNPSFPSVTFPVSVLPR